jgi:predicted aspartyl protease
MKLRVIAVGAALSVAGALLVAAPPAVAKDCPILRLLNSVQMEPVGDDNALLVPVTIQGVPKKLLLDTGGITSQLSESVVKELGLRERDSALSLIDITGHAVAKQARVGEFILGTMKAVDIDFQVAPTNFGGEAAGVLSTNLFAAYDIDIDFGTNKLNYISPDHCEGQVLYWKASVSAVVPMRLVENHIQLTVTLEGKPLDAILDTGAAHTTMSAEIANRVFGLTPDSPGMTALGNVNGSDALKSYGHVFDSLAFEGVMVRNPHIVIIPDIVGKGADQGYKTGSSIKRWSDDVKLPPIIIGMDVLKKLHVYIAFKERNLYITPAASPSNDASAAP